MVVLALTALINEALHDTLLYHLATIWLGFPTHGTGLKLQIEEGSELMVAAALGVILIETLTARPSAVPDAPGRGRRGPGRRAAALAVTVVLLAASAFPLLTHRVHQGRRLGDGRPVVLHGTCLAG